MMYELFASVYDAFMSETPYDLWASQLLSVLEKHGIEKGLAADLGCGTGSMTLRLAEAGFDMIGIDASADMLEVAREKTAEAGLGERILYLNQELEDFELYGTVAAAVAVCDVMNYLPNEAAWVQTLSLVNNYLDPGGIFVFDLRTEVYYAALGDCVRTDSIEEGSFLWENHVDMAAKTNAYTLELYVREDIASGGSTDRYVRDVEEHETHWLSREELASRVAASGMTLLGVMDADTLSEPTTDSTRLYVVCRECGKEHRPTA